jgi:hypothetical protein
MPQIGSFVQGIYRDESRYTAEITAALCAAAMEYLPVELDEDGYRGGHAYKYASIHSIRRATLAANCKHGIFVNHIYGDNDKGEYVTTVVRHVSGEYMSSTSPVKELHDVQDEKAGKTLLCRTHIEGLLGIITERDDDGQAASHATHQDKQREAEWANAFSLAKAAILGARDLVAVDRHLATVKSRIHEGRMAPGALQEIDSLCSQRKKELTPKKEVTSANDKATAGDQGPNAASSGSGSSDSRVAGRAAGVGRGDAPAGDKRIAQPA